MGGGSGGGAGQQRWEAQGCSAIKHGSYADICCRLGRRDAGRALEGSHLPLPASAAGTKRAEDLLSHPAVPDRDSRPNAVSGGVRFARQSVQTAPDRVQHLCKCLDRGASAGTQQRSRSLAWGARSPATPRNAPLEPVLRSSAGCAEFAPPPNRPARRRLTAAALGPHQPQAAGAQPAPALFRHLGHCPTERRCVHPAAGWRPEAVAARCRRCPCRLPLPSAPPSARLPPASNPVAPPDSDCRHL